MTKRCGLILFYVMSLPGLLAGTGRVRVLDDFESADSARNWIGDVRLAADIASHGRSSALVRFEQRGAEVGFASPQSDWRGYERLRFDVHSARNEVLAATLRIFDDPGGTIAPGHYEAEGKIFLLPGWNHVEVELNGLHVTSYERPLALARIRKLALSLARGTLPCALRLDNFRLVAGEEGRETASRTQPSDALIILDDRFFKVRQVADAEDVPEARDVSRLRQEAKNESARLNQAIHAAQTQGIETIYAERHLVTADLGLQVRPRLAWFNNDAAKREMFAYVAGSCREARLRLGRVIQGLDRLPAADDTQIGEPLIPPYPPLKGLPVRDGFFRDERGEPLFVISVHSPSRLLERFFADPRQHIESYSVGGGSRWTIDESPVYAAFRADPDTHRVGWDGWCGHLVRDLSSMGTPRWSPDGSEIVLDSEHGGNREIYVMNSQGGTPRRITADPAEDCLPSFSRDGRTIYFTSDRTGRCEVWRVARTGGAAVQLTRNGGVAPIETTDGKRVLYCRRIWDASELWSLPVEGGPETRVLGNIIVRDGTARTVTPRGVITLEAAQDPTTRQLNDIVPGRGTPLAIQPGPISALRLTPDFTTVRLHDFVTGRATVLTRLPGPVGSLALSPDENAVVYAEAPPVGSNIMLLENFR